MAVIMDRLIHLLQIFSEELSVGMNWQDVSTGTRDALFQAHHFLEKQKRADKNPLLFQATYLPVLLL